MNDINKYLEVLTEFAGRKLNQEFKKIGNLDFDDLGLVNSFLIYQSVNNKENRNNALIYFPDKDTKSEFYVPVIITLSLNSFIENYILSEKLSNGYNDDLFRSFFSYQFNLNNEKMPLFFKSKSIIVTEKIYENKLKEFSSSLFYLSINKLKKNIHTTNANKLKPLEYKIYVNREDFLNDVVKLIGKSDTKYFEEELFKSLVYDIHKAFPFQYITKTGVTTDNVPIDPMIYIVNDYQTARTYILNNSNNIGNIIFIGANKYRDCYLDISEDLNNHKMKNCLLIGSADVPENAIPNLLKWKWTLPELDYFNYLTTYEINKILVEDLHFSTALIEFDTQVNKVENEYGINLKELYKFIRNILPIIIPSQKSRIIAQLENSLLYFEKEGKDIVETALDEVGEYDYGDVWIEILEKFKTLIDCKKNSQSKFEEIKRFQRIDYLVVPKEYSGFWLDEMKNTNVKNIISFKEFNLLDVKGKTIVFLGFFGYDHLKSMMYNSNKINVILYPQEDSFYKNCLQRLYNETYRELRDSQRKEISQISFNEIEHIENVDDLIKRLFAQDEESILDFDHLESYNSNIRREITFVHDTECLELDENKTVFLKINNQERIEKVKNLIVGDRIRVYDNSSKEELYQVALRSDDDGEFSKIEEFSKLWKNELKTFFANFNSLEELHHRLISIGLSIKNAQTLHNWINVNSNVRFPQRKKDLSVLRKAIDSLTLNENYNNILKYRNKYNSIMRALGRRFSGEITEYILNRKKGDFLQQFTEMQIQQFVNQNAKERTIKSLKAIENE
jgi:hypothetical protein